MSQSGAEAVMMTVVSLLIARWFGDVLYGQLAVLLAGVQLVTMASDGFMSAIIRFVSLKDSESNSRDGLLGWQLSWLSTFFSLCFAGLVGIVAYSISGKQESLTFILLAVLLATFRTGRASIDSALRGLRTFDISAIAGIVSTMIMSGLLIYYTANGGRVAVYLGIVVLMTAINIIWLNIAFVKRFTVCPLWKLPSKALVNEFIGFSYPLILRGLFGFLALKINIWLIAWLATDADAGQFRLADQFLTIPALLFSAILSAMAPRIVKAEHDGHASLSELTARINGFMLLLSVPVAIFFVFNSFVIRPLFPGYEMATVMLAFYAPSILLRGMSYSASTIIVLGGKPKAAFWLSCIPSIGNVVFAFIGYYLYGVMGLVIGSALVQFVSCATWIFAAHRLFKIPFRFRLG